MSQSFANNAATTLAAAVTSTATSLAVANGSVFPLPAGGSFFLVTLVGYNVNGTENAWEIVRVTARSGNTLTVVRAQEGTAAQAWPTATLVEARLTAGSLDLKANLASPVFTGTPTAPTPAPGTNTTQIANAAFVQAALAALVDASPGTLDTLNELAAALGDDPNFATTMANALAAKAPLDSPTLTGDPKAPTAAATDSDTSIATTAHVKAAMALFGLGSTGVAQLANIDDKTTVNGTYYCGDVTAGTKPFVYGLVKVSVKGTGASAWVFQDFLSTSGAVFWRCSIGGAAWTPWQGLWHTGNLVKQADTDDLNAGRMVLTETVRRRLTGGLSNSYRDRLILLHPLYVSTFLPYSIVDGKITATRGGTASSLNQASVEVVSSSAYHGHATTFNSVDFGWQAVSCMYQGVKYAALIVPYNASAYGSGIYFEGRAVSTDTNQLLCVEYYDHQTATVLNAEVYDSITSLATRSDFRVCGDVVFRRGNILGTVSQSAGIPTGAIIERGSNANGEYVRYADGTQICTHRLALTHAANTDLVTTWTYPAGFVVSPYGAISIRSVNSTNTYTVNKMVISSLTTAAEVRTQFSAAQTYTLEFSVTGRWY